MRDRPGHLPKIRQGVAVRLERFLRGSRKESRMDYVYVVGIARPTGCMLTNDRAFSKFEDAEKELLNDRKNNIDYTKIYTLRVHHTYPPEV